VRLLSVDRQPGADLLDEAGLLQARYDGRPGTTYLVRPDQHVAARWRAFDPATFTAALARAGGGAWHSP
jgi:3-(3-hydroxy-phenyl)propionate hydroxylase